MRRVSGPADLCADRPTPGTIQREVFVDLPSDRTYTIRRDRAFQTTAKASWICCGARQLRPW
jgi:hypothetical protein